MPRVPWPSRLQSGIWTVAACCAVGAFALLLFSTTAYRLEWGASWGVLPRLAVDAAAALASAAVLGWARRWPLAVFGVLLAESVAAVALWDKTWPFFLAMDGLVCLIAATRPWRTTAAVVAVELLGWTGESLATWHGREGVSDILSMLAGLLLTIAVAWLAGDAIRRQREYGRALRTQAVTAERLRIARELHDMVAHSIGVIAIQAGAGSMVLDEDPQGARRALDAIESTSRETLAGLRRMLVSLRRADEESGRAEPVTGLEALDRLTERTAAAGLLVELSWHGERRPLPPEIDVAAFRIIQESVTNVVRHAGTERCRVSVEYGEDELAVEILDDGCGVPRAGARAGTGYGISGMRERVALLNGRFSAGSRPEGGFRVAARLPV